jgi:hypothetical protein
VGNKTSSLVHKPRLTGTAAEHKDLELKHTKSHAKIKQDWLRPVSRAAQ